MAKNFQSSLIFVSNANFGTLPALHSKASGNPYKSLKSLATDTHSSLLFHNIMANGNTLLAKGGSDISGLGFKCNLLAKSDTQNLSACA